MLELQTVNDKNSLEADELIVADENSTSIMKALHKDNL